VLQPQVRKYEETVFGDYVYVESVVLLFRCQWLRKHGSGEYSIFQSVPPYDGVNEVRRFGVDRDVVSSFGYLREKLQAVFPSLRGCDFTVAWRGK
jgi:hypothetical protein